MSKITLEYLAEQFKKQDKKIDKIVGRLEQQDKKIDSLPTKAYVDEKFSLQDKKIDSLDIKIDNLPTKAYVDNAIEDLAIMVNHGFEEVEKRASIRYDNLDKRLSSIEFEVNELGIKNQQILREVSELRLELNNIGKRTKEDTDATAQNEARISKKIISIEKELKILKLTHS